MAPPPQLPSAGVPPPPTPSPTPPCYAHPHSCYLDYSQLVIVNPRFVLVQGTFFYNAHTVLVGDSLTGFVMRENIYSLNEYGGNESVVLLPSLSSLAGVGGSSSTSAGSSTRTPRDTTVSCSKVVIEDEIDGQQATGLNHTIRLTSARKSLYRANATEWAFDFSSTLLLPRIDDVMYSLVLDDGQPLPMHAARAPDGAAVTVTTSEPVSGTVTMAVSQCGE